jgi:hypothetical protein
MLGRSVYRSSVTVTAVGTDEPSRRSECWCCGFIDDPDRMVHLGNHPEVALCLRCARWATKQAAQIEDLTRTGPLVRVRDQLRLARQKVSQHGWQRNRYVGGALRWLGKRLP